jgi:hypothetical protein
VFRAAGFSSRLHVSRFPPPAKMNLDKKFLQRAFLAFTTGLFLACAARVSTASAATLSDVPAVSSR